MGILTDSSEPPKKYPPDLIAVFALLILRTFPMRSGMGSSLKLAIENFSCAILIGTAILLLRRKEFARKFLILLCSIQFFIGAWFASMVLGNPKSFNLAWLDALKLFSFVIVPPLIIWDVQQPRIKTFFHPEIDAVSLRKSQSLAKRIVIAAGVILGLLLSIGYLGRIREYSGNFLDIPTFIAELEKTKTYESFLIITVADTPNFIQFRTTPDGIEIDFPLSTQNQKDHETLVRAAGKGLNLKLVEHKGTGGIVFLDYYVKATPEEVSKVISDLFKRVYSTTGQENLMYETSGFIHSKKPLK